VSWYFDSSALVKLVRLEPESRAMRAFILERAPNKTTSGLARTEVVRAAGPAGRAAVVTAREVLDACTEVALSRYLLDRAGELAHELGIRPLDAIHLASAEQVRPFIDGVVTYDRRMADAARAFDFEVVAPS
jgi:predicted nucleic acid-binding protein